MMTNFDDEQDSRKPHGGVTMDLGIFYVSTYCNFAHRCSDGKPVKHECRVIPPLVLALERRGDYERAISILRATPVRMMRRGVRG